MARPLKIESGGVLKEATDAELELITFWLRMAYANQLNNGGNGSINVGGSGTTIGTADDTISGAATASQTRNYSGGTDYPAAPALDNVASGTYTYKQDLSVPAMPSNTLLDNNSYLAANGGLGMRVAWTEANLYAEILYQCIQEMKTGDEIGTYRVATSSPGANYVDKGVWFVDDTLSGGTETYNYYLKTNGTSPNPNTYPNFLYSDSANSGRELTTISAISHSLISTILLPALTRRLDDGDLNYTVSTSAPVSPDVGRGSFINKRQLDSTTSFSFVNPTYYTTSTPAGGPKSTWQQYYLNLS